MISTKLILRLSMNKSNHIVKQTEGRRSERREKGKKEIEKGREGKEKEGKTNFFLKESTNGS